MKRQDKKLLKKLPKEAAPVVAAIEQLKGAGKKRDVNYLKAIEKLAFKALENIASVKFLILLISTVFFYIGKLSEGTWQETVLIIAGLRAVNEVAAMYKKPTPGATEESKD